MVEYTIRGREMADTTDSLLSHLLIVWFPGAGEEELGWSWGVRGDRASAELLDSLLVDRHCHQLVHHCALYLEYSLLVAA